LGAAAQQVLDTDLVRGTTAWTNDDVHYLDSSVWYIAPNGLPSVEQMVEEVAAAVE
jgi:iron complex transport system substrate-binding protein